MAGHLYFMRHGETTLNRQGIWQGRIDSRLSEKGLEQARAAGDHIRETDLEIDAAFCSPLGRARQTIETALPDQAYVTDEGLQEISFGSLEGKPNVDGVIGPYGDYFKRFGGESEDEACGRICAAVDAIATDHVDENVLVVSHGTMGRLFSTRWSDGTAPKWLPNCCLMEFAYDAGSHTFAYEGVWAPGDGTSDSWTWTDK
jgi:probable phosphoglycerate mutase